MKRKAFFEFLFRRRKRHVLYTTERQLAEFYENRQKSGNTENIKQIIDSHSSRSSSFRAVRIPPGFAQQLTGVSKDKGRHSLHCNQYDKCWFSRQRVFGEMFLKNPPFPLRVTLLPISRGPSKV